MRTREILLGRIAAYCAERQLTERQFGLAAVRDTKFITRLRAGKATLATIERAEAFMAAAADIDWQPDGAAGATLTAPALAPDQYEAPAPQPQDAA